MKYTNATLKVSLTAFRNQLRDGTVKVKYGVYGENAVKQALALCLAVTEFTPTSFNEQTLARFATLFEAPRTPQTGTLPSTVAWKYPTQDETASAVQNFINRRRDPWAHVRPASDFTSSAQVEASIT